MKSAVVERKYVNSLLARGFSHDRVKDELVSMGWHPESAKRAIHLSQHELCPSENATRSPGPDMDKLPTTIDVDGRTAKVQLRIHRPHICLLSDFLTAGECEMLIEQSRPRMERSMVIVGEGRVDEEGVQAYSRTSDQATFNYGASDLADKIRRRVALVARWPVDQMESTQVVRYVPGADFAPHYDYFCPQAHADLIAREGQRVGTALLYLNTPKNGGATAFPDVEFEVYPQRGNALFFSYTQPRMDTLTLHAGVPLGDGEKWIASFFFRDRPVSNR